MIDELHGSGERAVREGGAEVHVVLARRLAVAADVVVFLLSLKLADQTKRFRNILCVVYKRDTFDFTVVCYFVP